MYTLKQLRKMGKEQGIKMTSKLNTKTMCKLLNIPLVINEKFEKYHRHTLCNPVQIIFKSIDNNEQIEFPSISNAAKQLGKNPSCIPFYIKKNSTIFYNGKKYTVARK